MTYSAALRSQPKGIEHRLTVMEATANAVTHVLTFNMHIVYPPVDTDYTTEPICALLYSQRLRNPQRFLLSSLMRA